MGRAEEQYQARRAGSGTVAGGLGCMVGAGARGAGGSPIRRARRCHPAGEEAHTGGGGSSAGSSDVELLQEEATSDWWGAPVTG
jgi:hypothetical protein